MALRVAVTSRALSAGGARLRASGAAALASARLSSSSSGPGSKPPHTQREQQQSKQPEQEQEKRWQLLPKLDADRGHLSDINKTKKIFVAAQSLTPPADLRLSPYLPEVAVDCLSGENGVVLLKELQGSVTLLGVSLKQFGFAMLPSWMDAMKAAHPSAKTARLSLAEGLVVSFLKPLLLWDMRRNVSPELQPHVYVLFGDAEDVRIALDLKNAVTGYVFLVDRAGRVRWRACGSATDQEVQSMLSCYQQLLMEPVSSKPPRPRKRT